MLREEVKQVHEIADEAVKPLVALVNELLMRIEKLEKAAAEKAPVEKLVKK